MDAKEVERLLSQPRLLQDVIDGRCVCLGPVAELPAALEGSAGILSRPFTAPGDAAEHYTRAALIFAAMDRLGRLSRLLPEDEVSLFARLFETAGRAQVEAFVLQRLRPIEARDPGGRAKLKATLRSYFAHQFSVTRTAAALDIHVNTARHRLATLTQVPGDWGRSGGPPRPACRAPA